MWIKNAQALNGKSLNLVQKLNNMGVKIFDSFNRSDVSSSLGTADTGQTWQNGAGIMGISGSQVYKVSGGLAPTGDVLSLAESTIGDGVVKCTVTNTAWSAAFVGISMRYIDASNFLLYVLNSTTLAIYRRDSGTWTALSNVPFVPVNNTVYELKVVMLGTNIKTYRDGILIHDLTLSGADATKFTNARTIHGIHTSTTTSRQDNFEVTL